LDGGGGEAEKRKKLPARRHRSFGERRYVALAYTRRRRVVVADIPTTMTATARDVKRFRPALT
jgi:hypothetical protein